MCWRVRPVVDVVEPQPAEPPAAPPRRSVAVIALAVAIVCAVFFVVLVFAKGSSDTAKTELLDHAAPPIESPTVDGQAFDLSTRRGSWVVLNFFATWCTPCRSEHPELLHFAQTHQGSGVELVSIADATDTKGAIDDFVSHNGGAGDWPIVTDPSSEVRISYGVAKTPETWIVDPDGVVRARVITTVTAAKLDDLLRRVSGGTQG
jgi:cytochrome c biogenesis protein CcmG, thiol:disulfide interchange protein DsbE